MSDALGLDTFCQITRLRATAVLWVCGIAKNDRYSYVHSRRCNLRSSFEDLLAIHGIEFSTMS
jgi:hypothetical protein